MERHSRLVLAAALAAALAACKGAEDTTCASGQVLCGGCYDPARFETDDWNCGACGIRCAHGATCVAGLCRCAPGLTPCNGTCVDLQTSHDHCGACDVSCGHGTCAGGACTCDAGATPCTGPGSQCVDPTSDATDCGACRAACPARESCVRSACQCLAPYVLCGGVCTSTATDEANCGACGHACPAGGSCSSSLCVCPAGPPGGCATSCCAGGSACCTSGACPLTHDNGLGQHFYDCHALYAPAETTLAAALAAANAWKPGAVPDDTSLFTSCLARRTTTHCAVWCYGTSSAAGRVQMTTGACVRPTGASPAWR